MAWSRVASGLAPFRAPPGRSLLNRQLGHGFAQVESVDAIVMSQPPDQVDGHPHQGHGGGA